MRSAASRTTTSTYRYCRADSVANKDWCKAAWMAQGSPRILRWLFGKDRGVLPCWAVFALGQSYYLLNLSSDLALNLPRCKNKTQNCSTDFSV